MGSTPPTSDLAAAFVARWSASGGAERANYQLFLTELCDLLAVPRPDPARPDDQGNAYVFERAVTFLHGDGTTSRGRIDLYKRGCFVLETKQGTTAKAEGTAALFKETTSKTRAGHGVRGTAGWDAAMESARGQAEGYVRALPASETNPPFVVVVDVGHTIELYADFSRLGKTYTPFPDARSHRIALADLADAAIRARLAAVWTDPLSLDPTRRSAKVTREVAATLAELAKRLEASKHDPETVAEFLMRCIFTFFAEDVKLIKDHAFTQLLEGLKGQPENFPHLVQPVWREMDKGVAFSPVLRQKILQFNGGLFEHSDALPLNERQLQFLIDCGKADWSDVEPAIFGTLLERALSPDQRHKLGAHYTPRAYVERLVLPTVIEPLREQFDAAKAAAFTLSFQGKPAEARSAVKAFLHQLCETVVLDPACGSGNFLYVTMDQMKRLEEEARRLLFDLGEPQEVLQWAGETVDPHQFLGLEINPRAVEIADLVLWIGYLQWHFRTHGNTAPREPVLRAYHNIREQDAVLAYDSKELVTDEQGKPVSRWDGRTMKVSPVTGEDVPDEAARVPVYRYVNPRKAEWPKADFVVGNPPYIGVRRQKGMLGDEYVETLREAYDDVPDTSDYVMYWWHRAAALAESRQIERFGLITTDSITQDYSRGLIEQHLSAPAGIALAFAVADHPWVEAADGAAVRVAMTVGTARNRLRGPATLGVVTFDDEHPEQSAVSKITCEKISSWLRSGDDQVAPLRSNENMCFQGVVPAGDGFKLSRDELSDLGLSASALPATVRSYVIGKDLVQAPEPKFIIDFFGFSETEARSRWPALYQRLLDRVRPERIHNKRAAYRDKWWIFAEPRPALRKALAGVKRFAVTPYTAKHRPFVFVDGTTTPDAMAYAIASDDAYVLGVLSSRTHVAWALSTGGTLEDRPRYNSKVTFLPFPFPAATESQRSRIRELGEALDAHRKRQQAAHPGLTITDMYNVLTKLRAGETLSDKDKRVHEQGLVSVLKQIHDDLDAAVAEAYGWPADLPDDELLRRLVALNAERAAEERRGQIRWLRPEFQNPDGAGATTQGELELKPDDAATKGAKAKAGAKPAWPASLAEQARAVRAALQARTDPVSAADLSAGFKGGKKRDEQVAALLETLVTLGQARRTAEGKFTA